MKNRGRAYNAAGDHRRGMKMGQKKNGMLPEGGEMLILAIVMFFGIVGTVTLIWFLAPAP